MPPRGARIGTWMRGILEGKGEREWNAPFEDPKYQYCLDYAEGEGEVEQEEIASSVDDEVEYVYSSGQEEERTDERKEGDKIDNM